MTLSRRALIHRVGKAGGVAAAYRTMAAMGLLPIPDAYAGPPDLPPGNGRKIVIIGAGIAGMVLAWELRKSGYAPTILEARSRPGGRNWSLRAGDEIRETDGVQRVRWDAGEHLYFNPGPARLPYHHQGILSYCRELDVALEVMCNDNRGALLHDEAAFDGKPQRNRQVVNDIRGYVAELAAKAVDQEAMAQPVSTEDKERIRAFLRAFGALDRDMTYKGSGRAGYAEPPGGGTQEGRRSEPLELREILASSFWGFEHEFRRSLASGGDDDAAGRRHGPHRPGIRPQARREHHLQCRSDGAAPCGKRRARRLEGYEDRRQARDRGAAGRGDHSVAGAAHNPGRFRQRDARRDRGGGIHPGRQDRVPGRAPVLGAGSGDLRRHFVDDARHHPDLVSLGRHQPAEGHPGRRLYLDRPISATNSPPCRRRSAWSAPWRTANACIRATASI